MPLSQNLGLTLAELPLYLHLICLCVLTEKVFLTLLMKLPDSLRMLVTI